MNKPAYKRGFRKSYRFESCPDYKVIIMEKYELDLTAGDIGEIIEIIRVQHLRLHAEPFANKIGMKEKVLLSIEEGRGPHGLLALKKMNETFHNVKVKIFVEVY